MSREKLPPTITPVNSITLTSSTFLLIPTLFSSDIIIRILFLALACTSILYHAFYFDEYPGKHMLDKSDRILAHVVIGYMFLKVFVTVPSKLNILILSACLCYITYVYYIGNRIWQEGTEGYLWHASIHIVGVIAAIIIK